MLQQGTTGGVAAGEGKQEECYEELLQVELRKEGKVELGVYK